MNIDTVTKNKVFQYVLALERKLFFREGKAIKDNPCKTYPLLMYQLLNAYQGLNTFLPAGEKILMLLVVAQLRAFDTDIDVCYVLRTITETDDPIDARDQIANFEQNQIYTSFNL